MTTAREKFFYTRTLCGLLKALEGLETEIELRNDAHVKGTVESVCGSMSVVMNNCELIVAGRARKLQRLLIQGRKIRMVMIPDDIKIIDAMQSVVNMYNAPVLGRLEYGRSGLKGRGRGKPRGRGRGRGVEVGRESSVQGMLLRRGRGSLQGARGRAGSRDERGEAGTTRFKGRGFSSATGSDDQGSLSDEDVGHFGTKSRISSDAETMTCVSGQPVNVDGASQNKMLRPEYIFGQSDATEVSGCETKKMSSENPPDTEAVDKEVSLLCPTYMQQVSVSRKPGDKSSQKQTQRQSGIQDDSHTSHRMAQARSPVLSSDVRSDRSHSLRSTDLRHKLRSKRDSLSASKGSAVKHGDESAVKTPDSRHSCQSTSSKGELPFTSRKSKSGFRDDDDRVRQHSSEKRSNTHHDHRSSREMCDTHSSRSQRSASPRRTQSVRSSERHEHSNDEQHSHRKRRDIHKNCDDERPSRSHRRDSAQQLRSSESEKHISSQSRHSRDHSR